MGKYVYEAGYFENLNKAIENSRSKVAALEDYRDDLKQSKLAENGGKLTKLDLIDLRYCENLIRNEKIRLDHLQKAFEIGNGYLRG